AALAAVHQLALAAGAPWGQAAYGGRVTRPDGRLPGTYRGISALNGVFLGLVAWFLASVGGHVTAPLPHGVTTAALWFLVVMFGLNTLANLAARHPVERWGLGGGTAVLAACCLALT
ncbi:MAG TPA: hypothetical protein VGE77_00660, partial [Nocardioides sp.]